MNINFNVSDVESISLTFEQLQTGRGRVWLHRIFRWSRYFFLIAFFCLIGICIGVFIIKTQSETSTSKKIHTTSTISVSTFTIPASTSTIPPKTTVGIWNPI